MDDTKSKLEKIEALRKNIEKITRLSSEKKSRKSQNHKEVSIEEIIKGKFFTTPFGTSFIRENYFYPDYKCGEIELGQVSQVSPKIISHLARDDRFNEFDIKQAVFLDTETTGLAGGAGTYIFLVGVGYFENDKFCVKQYFMRDFNEERALLSALNDLLRDFKAVVTYNGKNFDLPLMESRYIIAGINMIFRDSYHFDLLYPVRRLWKRRLENCSLSTVERDILKVRRINDIPGFLIPEIYFRYLKTKDARELGPVFDHNLQDILSLVALVSKIGKLVENPLSQAQCGTDILGVGRIFDELKNYEKSSCYYKEALRYNLSEQELKDILSLGSLACKRKGEWEEAEKMWKELIEIGGDFNYFPYEELAKYYEHRLKDYSKAEQIVTEALEQTNNIYYLKQLQYRLTRIKNKQM